RIKRTMFARRAVVWCSRGLPADGFRDRSRTRVKAMRLPRMSTRRWMVAVAVVATLLFTLVEGARMHRRQAFCLKQAAVAALTEANWKAGRDRIASLLASVERQCPPDVPAEVREELTRSLRAELLSMTPK